MEAAQASNQAGDFKTEAIILADALDFAKLNDSQGQRPALTRIPLMLAYGELDRKDLIKPLAAEGMHIDVSNLDSRFNDYIGTVDNYASSYYDRWIAHQNDTSADDFKQDVRFYGAKNSYRIEIALRTKLRPDDEIGLASAMALVGLVYKRNADFDCAGYDYGRAFQSFLDFQQKRDAMTIAGGRFSTASADQSTTGQAVIDTQVYLVVAAANEMTEAAAEHLQPTSSNSSAAKIDLSAECDNFGPPAQTPPAIDFDAEIGRASAYFDALLKLTSELHSHWPSHPIFGAVDRGLAGLYQVEFEMSKVHPQRYPGSLAKARKNYEESLSIFTHSAGANSQIVHDVASDYIGMLLDAKLPNDAKTVEQRYGIPPPK